MRDPKAWLTAKLAEVEARAKAAARFDRHWQRLGGSVFDDDGAEPMMMFYNEHFEGDLAEHIAFWDPAMVLRLVAATRAVLELHFHPYDVADHCTLCGYGEGDGNVDDGWWPCGTVKALAKGWGWTHE